jgi:hypothetical protein
MQSILKDILPWTGDSPLQIFVDVAKHQEFNLPLDDFPYGTRFELAQFWNENLIKLDALNPDVKVAKSRLVDMRGVQYSLGS